MRIRKTIFGRVKAQPNTFIGGVGMEILTASDLVSKLNGISVSNIKMFQTDGTNISCHVDSNYSIANNAFENNLNITYFVDLESKCTGVNANAFHNAANISTIKIPGATVMNYRSFRGCSALYEIDMPLMSIIHSESFSYCYNLTILNDSFTNVTTVGNMAFRGCSSITALNLPNVGLCNLNNATYMFAEMTNLVSIFAPNLTVGGGSNNIFRDCTAITTVNLNSLNIVSTDFFRNCSSLTTLNLPSVKSLIGNGAFYKTSNLTSLYFPALITISNVQYRTFYLSAVQNLDFSNVTDMSGVVAMFEQTSNLLSVDIRNVTSTIGSSTGNNSVFLNIKTGVTIYANIIQQTINSGAPDGDLNYAVSNRSANIIYN